MAEEANERLKQFLNDARNGKGRLLIYQVYFCSDYPVLKEDLPLFEINPVDTHGSITKKRGVVIRSASELDEISHLFGHTRVGEPSKKIDAVNPKREAATSKGHPDIFEI
jgi:hypothetical protein